MITYVKGDLFQSPAKVLVNTVNTVGVMGRGIAKVFKEIYPDMFSQYQSLCENKQFQIGQLWLHKTRHKWILNFPTKRHWRYPSKAEYIEEGLKKFVDSYSALGITSIAFPQLGCGNGQLDWEKVIKPLMERYLGKLPIDVFIYTYGADSFTPEHEDVEAMSNWLRSEPQALAFTEVWKDICELIGAGTKLRTFDDTSDFEVFVTNRPEDGDGLLISVKAKTILQQINSLLNKVIHKGHPKIIGQDIFIPQASMLNLWQNIRAYGFCVARTMPDGLDILAPCILALLARLDYMKRVVLSTSEGQKSGVSETGLQLIQPSVAPLMRTRATAVVQPV